MKEALRIHPAVAASPRLSAKAKLCWGHLNTATQLGLPVSIPDLAAWLCCTEPPASKALRELEALDLLDVTRQNGKRNLYSVREPV